MMNRVDELLGGGEAIDGSQLDQIEMGLKEKLGVIKGLDGELLEIIEEVSLEDEIAEADLHKERVYSTLITIQKARTTNTVPATAVPAAAGPGVVPTATTVASSVRLPKLTSHHSTFFATVLITLARECEQACCMAAHCPLNSWCHAPCRSFQALATKSRLSTVLGLRSELLFQSQEFIGGIVYGACSL